MYVGDAVCDAIVDELRSCMHSFQMPSSMCEGRSWHVRQCEGNGRSWVGGKHM